MNKIRQINRNTRRLGKDRREFSYSMNIPERRFGGERRNGLERRITWRRDVKTGSKSRKQREKAGQQKVNNSQKTSL
jgi:hypothetical protein